MMNFEPKWVLAVMETINIKVNGNRVVILFWSNPNLTLTLQFHPFLSSVFMRKLAPALVAILSGKMGNKMLKKMLRVRNLRTVLFLPLSVEQIYVQ